LEPFPPGVPGGRDLARESRPGSHGWGRVKGRAQRTNASARPPVRLLAIWATSVYGERKVSPEREFESPVELLDLVQRDLIFALFPFGI
jgi:hypothetical protein